MREGYRLQKNSLEEVLVNQKMNLAVFIIYTGNELPGYPEIYNQMIQVLKRLNKIVYESVATNP